MSVSKIVYSNSTSTIPIPIGTSYTYSTSTGAYYTPTQLQNTVVATVPNYQEKETKKEMDMTANFGPVTSSNITLSTKGIAIKNNNDWVIYNAEKQSIEIVTPFILKGKFLYKIPVAPKDLKVNDIIVFSSKFYVILSLSEADTRMKVIDLASGEEKTILPAQSPFGFNFFTKIISILDVTKANENNPFGDPMMWLLMSDNKPDLLPFLLMKNDNIDPMMLMLLMNQNKAT